MAKKHTNGEAVLAVGPRVLIEWPFEGSSRPDMTIENVDYMQLASAAELLRWHAEQAYADSVMKERMEEIQRQQAEEARKPRLMVPGRVSKDRPLA